MEIEPIGHVESPFPVKFGVPRQPGLVRGLHSALVYDGTPAERASWGGGRAPWPPLGERDSPFLWVLWGFSENGGRAPTPTIRPPRLGGNARVGVFASRSSFRPNGLAVSVVKEIGMNGNEPHRKYVEGADMVDGSPVFGVRPYASGRDRFPGAASGWVAGHAWPALAAVRIPAELEARVPEELREGLRGVLLQDPRPAYTRQTQPERVFWLPLGHVVIQFRVEGATAVVVGVDVLDEDRYRRLRETGAYVEEPGEDIP